jgi:hypothetical protein
MHGQLRQWMFVALGVFLVAVIVSLVASGSVSDIAFVVYVVALVVAIGLAIAWLASRGKGGPTAGRP